LQIAVACDGIAPLLSLSATRIAVPPLSIGEEVEIAITIAAGKKASAKFEVQAPAIAQLLGESFGTDVADSCMTATLSKSLLLTDLAETQQGGQDAKHVIPEPIEARPGVGRVAAGDSSKIVLTVRMTKALAMLIQAVPSQSSQSKTGASRLIEPEASSAVEAGEDAKPDSNPGSEKTVGEEAKDSDDGPDPNPVDFNGSDDAGDASPESLTLVD